MSDSKGIVENAPRASGRLLVVGFVGLVVVITFVAVGIRWVNRARIHAAQVKAMPTLSANVDVVCEGAAGKAKLDRDGACASGSKLRLSATLPGDGTRALVVALLGPHPTVEKLAFGQTIELPLSGSGPRDLALVLANRPVDPAPLRALLQKDAAVDVREQMTDAESFVSAIISRDGFARVERFAFRVGG